MAKLFAAKRNALPSSEFALPGKRAFPIPDKTHAVQALRMKGNASPSEQGEIVSDVQKKFPSVGKGSSSLLKRLTGK